MSISIRPNYYYYFFPIRPTILQQKESLEGRGYSFFFFLYIMQKQTIANSGVPV